MDHASEQHRFLQFEPPQPGRRVLRDVALALINFYFKANLSRTRWLKIRPHTVSCWEKSKDKQGADVVREWKSKPISLTMFESHLEAGTFDYKAFDLVNPYCDWLDAEVHGGPMFHAVDSAGGALRFRMPTTLGDAFPLVPTIDREGYAFNSFQMLLQKRIVSLRADLVASSNDFTSDIWFQNLRSYFSECVSLIDVTLHQLYHKAEYSPLPGWVFDRTRLGDRHGRSLKDKLGWVYQITRNPLQAEAEKKAFFLIKDLRNHLQHFDPPCFCYTLEDVVIWLNAAQEVARLAWKMREAMGSSLSVPLIQLLLAPKVQFIPKDPTRPRNPQPADVGYASTRMPLKPS